MHWLSHISLKNEVTPQVATTSTRPSSCHRVNYLHDSHCFEALSTMVLPKLPFTKPKTRGQILDARKKGLIIGWCVKIPKGRPPKSDSMRTMTNKRKEEMETPRRKTSGVKRLPSFNNEVGNKPSSSSSPKKKKARRLNYHRDRETWSMLKDAVIEFARIGDKAVELSPIPLSTVKDNALKFASMAKRNSNGIVKDVTYEQFWGDSSTTNKSKPSLLDGNQVLFLQEVIVERDNGNNPMTRHEVIQLITEISQCFDEMRAKNHFDYLIREKKLNLLKRDGKVSTAQATTTKRSAVTAEQQWRWHSMFDNTYTEMKKRNTADGSGVDFDDVCEHFVGNIDESCFMANSDGKVKVIASAAKRKTEANRDDCRASVTSIRCGNAAGDQGPFIFLAKGKKNEVHPSLNPKNLENDRNMTPGSYIAMSDNAYMTDTVWLEIVPKLCHGIRKMPVIVDHPNWWCTFTLDGFGSHVNVNEAHGIFAQHKILIIKEEGNSSHVNQAYDQLTAKADKRLLNVNLIRIKKNLGQMMSQWHLIKIAADAQAKVSSNVWINSFVRVNLHPKYRLSFEDWVKKLESKGVLASGRMFYDDNTFGLYDAMPAFWRRMPPEIRENFVMAVDRMYDKAKKGRDDNEEQDEEEEGTTTTAGAVWCTENIRKLTRYVPLEDIHKARSCYLAAKRDDKVITTTDEEYTKLLSQAHKKHLKEEEEGTTMTRTSNNKIDKFFSLRPARLMEAYQQEKADPKKKHILSMCSATTELFGHMCNHAAQMNWNSKGPLQPSDALNVEMTSDQVELFNPSYKNVLQGYIMYDVRGAGAKKKLAKRRLDVLEGNVASYARCLNDSKRLDALKEFNTLVASVAEISAEVQAEREKKKADATARAQEKKDKKHQVEQAFQEVQAAKMPELEGLMNGREDDNGVGSTSVEESCKKRFQTFNKRQLLDLLKYYYTAKIPGIAKMQKEELIEELWTLDSFKKTNDEEVHEPATGATTRPTS